MRAEGGPRRRHTKVVKLPKKCCSTCMHYNRMSSWCRNLKKRVRLKDVCLGWDVIRY